MRPRESAVLLAGVAIAVAAVGLPAAGWLLVGAALVVAVLDALVAVIAMLPGAATVVDGALARGDLPAVAAATAVIGLGVLTVTGATGPPRGGWPRWWPAAGVIGAAFLLLSSTWGGDTARENARGAAIALAAGLLAVVVGWSTGQVQPPWLRTRAHRR